MNSQEDLFKIALTRIPHVGAVTAKNLISYCGSLEAIFRTKKTALMRIPGVGETLAYNILNSDCLIQAEKELDFVREHEIRIFFFTDDTYPRRLKPFPQSPVLLYGKGKCPLNEPRVLSVVGTRKPTSYGRMQCEKIIRELSAFNILVVSGLAYGIDILAHRSCLENGIPTVGILGSGIGRLYPSTHRPVAEEMLAEGGILSEFSFKTGPDKENFPARNRVVAALSDATLVVESAGRGGSLITAAFANAFHRDVFALPGRVNDRVSAGCNTLIKDHQAQLVETAADIAAFMDWATQSVTKGIQTQLFAELNDQERLIFELLQEKKERDIDSLSYFAKMKNSEISSVLLSLEFKGIIKALPGKRYTLI